jgi:hypothetical protein
VVVNTPFLRRPQTSFAERVPVVELGERTTAERVRRALEAGEPVLLALRPSEPSASTSSEIVPSRLRHITVAAGCAADYDPLLGGAR